MHVESPLPEPNAKPLLSPQEFGSLLQRLEVPEPGSPWVHLVLVLEFPESSPAGNPSSSPTRQRELSLLEDRLFTLPTVAGITRLRQNRYALLWTRRNRQDLPNLLLQVFRTLTQALPDTQRIPQLPALGVALLPDDAPSGEQALSLAEMAAFPGGGKEQLQSFQGIDAYGREAKELLQWAHPFLAPHADALAEQFYAAILADPDNAAVLRLLTPAEFQHLQSQQAAYIRNWLDPALTKEKHADRAIYLGKIHEYLGIKPEALVSATRWYRQQLLHFLSYVAARWTEKQHLYQIIALRIDKDLMWQSQGAQQLQAEISSLIENLYPKLEGVRNWFAALDQLMSSLRDWPMLHSAWLLEQDTQGRWFCRASTLQSSSADAPFCFCATGSDTDSRFSPDHPVVRAHLGERTLIPQLTPAMRSAWKEEDPAVHSLAALPLGDGSGRTHGILFLKGKLPNQFSTNWIRPALDGLQQVLLLAKQQIGSEVISSVTQEQRAFYRAQLFGGGLRMFMQPLWDLRNQRCTKVEALARLQLPDGSLVSPGIFLPLLNDTELNRLFMMGLDQALGYLRDWEEQGLEISLSINLPPTTLIDPSCPQWIADALASHGVSAARLTLEVLESPGTDYAAYSEAISRLHELGVLLAMDDLGSGYSSLQRLQQLPFDCIKIDQGLIRSLHQDPGRGIAIVGGLLALGKALALDVIVEGVEDTQLIEMAQLLGADSLQGYGVARPMPAETFPQWLQNSSPFPASDVPQSFLGLVASHWLWEQGQGDRFHPDPAAAHLQCRVGRFLAAQGWQESPLALVHEQMHKVSQLHGFSSPEYRLTRRRFFHILQTLPQKTVGTS